MTRRDSFARVLAVVVAALLSLAGWPGGARAACSGETEVDQFPNSRGRITLRLPTGATEMVALAGPSTMHVCIGAQGQAADPNGNGRDDVATELAQLQLTGTSALGPVTVTLNANMTSLGGIEENVNSTAGVLDVPPFTATGTAASFFDVFVEVAIGGQTLHGGQAARMVATISHKPPAPGETYVGNGSVALLDANGNPSGLSLLFEQYTPNPDVEIDHFPDTSAVVDLMLPDGSMHTVSLSGPTTVQVWVGPNGEADDSTGNGLDDVDTEMVQLQLTGVSPVLGTVVLRLADPMRHPAFRSVGMIEETANTQAGRLDLPPFAPSGTATSFFDVFFEVEVAGQVYHSHAPKRMRTYITYKPPGPGTAYFDPTVIELFNANEQPTGIKVLRASHVPSPPAPEIDHFPNTSAVVDLMLPDGSMHTVSLSGPTTVQVLVGLNGEANDSTGNGLDDVDTEMVQLQLTGVSPVLGPVVLRLADPMRHPAFRSVGMIEETANTQAGRLDLPPFAPSGTATSFFDVFFEVEVAGQVYHSHAPKRMRTYLTYKPPGPGTAYFDPTVIELFNANEQPTGIKVLRATHVPSPPAPEIDHFPNSLAQITLQLPNGSSEVVGLAGPTTVHVWVSPTGGAADTDGNGRDQVKTEIVQLQLMGSSSLGPVMVRLNPTMPSLGEIEENVNNTAGVLDVPPFRVTGMATSFFGVFFEVEVGGRTLHNNQAAHMVATIRHKPPAPGEMYLGDVPLDLFDSNNNATGLRLTREKHTPNPRPSSTPDDFDGDGIDDAVEDGAPNGDGNNDGTPDREQPNVSSLPSATGRGYVTVVASGPNGCGELLNIQALQESDVGFDPLFDYPLGLIGLKLNCSTSATITLFFHGGLFGLPLHIYRAFGPVPPAFAAPGSFYNLPGVMFGVANVPAPALTATMTLTNGMLGDQTPAADNMIISQGGPAAEVLAAVPVASTLGISVGVLLLALVAWRSLVRKRCLLKRG